MRCWPGAPRESYDRVLVLGDLVGYGANPNEVVDRIFDLKPDVMIRGNHDKVATGVEATDSFNRVAAEAARWTQSALTPENRKRVAALPAGSTERGPRHRGLPRDTVRRGHLRVRRGGRGARRSSPLIARSASLDTPTCRSPMCEKPPSSRSCTCNQAARRQPWSTSSSKPGISSTRVRSGQPRDTDPRASYAVYDTKKQRIEIRRVPYANRSGAAADHRGGSPREPGLPARPRPLAARGRRGYS